MKTRDNNSIFEGAIKRVAYAALFIAAFLWTVHPVIHAHAHDVHESIACHQCRGVDSQSEPPTSNLQPLFYVLSESISIGNADKLSSLTPYFSHNLSRAPPLQ